MEIESTDCVSMPTTGISPLPGLAGRADWWVSIAAFVTVRRPRGDSTDVLVGEGEGRLGMEDDGQAPALSELPLCSR